MTDPGRGSGPPRGGRDDDEPPGVVRPTDATTLVAWGGVGVIGGWALHPVGERLLGAAPVVTWTQTAVLGVLVFVVGWFAWVTHRSLQVHHERLEPDQAVGRLLLARAAALVGSLVGGGYLGYAVSWINDPSALADQRLWRSAVCAGLGVATLVAALLLERACRVRSDDPES